MNEQITVCKNCKKGFEITQDDQNFYEKMKVPAPTWCYPCRLQRRLSFRNDRNIYKRKCNAPGHDEEIIAMYRPEQDLTVYDKDYWWSDNWDPLSYGKEYDFNRTFFEQLRELMHAVPYANLQNINGVKSDYCNFTTDNKNCYLVFGGDFNEDCMYSMFNFHSRDSLDLYWVDNVQLGYELVDSGRNYNVMFSRHIADCQDCMLMYNCVGCSNCFGCVNLKNKSYCIFNEQYSKEAYIRKIEELKPYTYSNFDTLHKRFMELKLTQPHKYADILKSVNTTGDNAYEVKNGTNVFDVMGPAEDIKDAYLAGWGLKDAQSVSHLGHKTELAYESTAVCCGAQNIKFSFFIFTGSNVEYSYNCYSSDNIFGCASLRNKQYCILNKQYSKEEYGDLVSKIKKHMDEMPYLVEIPNLKSQIPNNNVPQGNDSIIESQIPDPNTLVYRYGEFFPLGLALCAYNESVASEHFLLNKDEALRRGYMWKENAEKSHAITLTWNELPDTIVETDESILRQIISCKHEGSCDDGCVTAFRITPQEFQFYKRMNIFVPRLCPNCRHYERLRQRNPIKQWDGNCQCGGMQSKNGVHTNVSKMHQSHDPSQPCANTFKTTYAPDRKEIIYCEQCYQSEIA